MKNLEFNRKYILISFVSGAALFAIMTASISWSGGRKSQERAAIRKFLEESNQPFICSFNGNVVENGNEIVLSAVKSTRDHIAHHSSPSRERIKIVIHSGTFSIKLEVARDSRIKEEFWVFSPSYFRGEDEIGSFKSKEFSDLVLRMEREKQER